MRQRGTETVLVVDDESELLAFIERVLVSSGYEVLVSSSAEEALRIPDNKKKKVDLLLADVILPGIMGHELAEAFKDIHPDVKLLFMSGYMCPAIAREGSGRREEAFLQKPFSPSTLINKMKKILR